MSDFFLSLSLSLCSPRRQDELESKLIEDETQKRVEELVAKRVAEELERRKDEIEAEVLRRVEEAKKVVHVHNPLSLHLLLLLHNIDPYCLFLAPPPLHPSTFQWNCFN